MSNNRTNPEDWFKVCPVGFMLGSRSHDFDMGGYTRCIITSQEFKCRSCNKSTRSNTTRCELGWNVCRDCYPKGCRLYSHAENENPTVGVVKYV